MAGASSLVCSCYQGLNESHLRSAIYSEVQKGYSNTFFRTMRFSNLLHSQLLKWCSKSNCASAQKLLEEVCGYSTASVSERTKFLNKVLALMGFNNVQDLIERDLKGESDIDLEDVSGELDLRLACARFPSIILGDSSLVDLYDEVPAQHENFSPLLPDIPDSLGTVGTDYDQINETWQFFSSSSENRTSQSNVKGSYKFSYNSPAEHDNGDVKLENRVATEQSLMMTVGNESLQGLSTEITLDKTVKAIPGTTSKQCRQLEVCGFHTVRKLLHHLPRNYADLQNAYGAVDDNAYLLFVGRVISSRAIRAGYSFSFLEVVVQCEFVKNEANSEYMCNDYDNGGKKIIYLHLKKFFRGTRFTYQPFLTSIQSKYEEGDCVCVSGKVKKMKLKNHYEMREYNIDILEDEEEKHAHLECRPYPLYPSKAGLKPTYFRDIILRALKILPANIDPVPDEILKEFNLLKLHDAYMQIHSPKTLDEADLARRRLIFDEFFYLQLARLYQMLEALGSRIEKEELLDKYKNQELHAVSVEEWFPLTKKLLKALPYSLTPSQLNAVSEIIWDLKRPVPMNRLLQGDVGCGKTVVAFLACMEVIASGYQAAFMVPTELLAIQHYEHVLSLLQALEDGVCKPSVALLTGSTPAKQSRAVLEGIKTGDISFVIGTHSLIAEKVEFSNLRIAVIDEQHRFGVIQRGRFNSKLYSIPINLRVDAVSLGQSSEESTYMAPHVLAMSATPIPRTLALALYGDMSITQITDLPPGRTPIETIVLEGNDVGFESVFQMMRDELVAGGKVYLVYPVIEESEQLPQLRAATCDFDSISKKFEEYKCGLLHGRMKSEQKDEALRKFRSGETCILLATQVIEIGVDVPDASMMVVMNAERFGIAQLHQLRGRVGRGTKKSRCFFLSSTSGTLERLKVLEKSSDGFYLAQTDLLLRGPGNLLGKKQSGHLPEFPIARLEIDGNMLQEAHLAALKVLATSYDLESFPGLKAELSMRQPLCILGD
ncbi:putative DNA helicase [Dioscorea sansibarensis]